MSTMTAPHTSQTPPQAFESETWHKLPLHPHRVLIADDEHLVASGVAVNLRELGYEVLGPASDGDEALALCETSHPDMALLDIRMPKRDGLAAAEIAFRQMGIPVMIFSAYSDPEYVSSGNRVGVFGYLLKPVTQDQMRVGISVAWGRFLDYAQHHTEILSLRQRLEDRKIIEQAKWILVKRRGIEEPDAMRLLQKQARNNRRPLVEVARAVLENDQLFGET
ncbi:MAG TPA: response regulator [Phycisphaerales bacterium]|jgi:AmiR/NasT family two-component response regulator|nr:response regulator [Phycisphaerales bacterium]